MKCALAVLLTIVASTARADDADIANGLANLKEIFAFAQVLGTYRSLGSTPELKQTIDPWGTPYRVDIDAYRVVGAGSDRKFDESTWETREQFAGTEGDVVFANGNFVRTNHNWLYARVTPGSASETKLAELRKAETLLLATRTPGMRKVLGSRMTAGTLTSFSILMESYRRKHGSLAAFAPPADAMKVFLAEFKLLPAAVVDAWGTPLRLEVDGESYRIISAGADRTFDPMSWSRPPKPDPAEDLVLENGAITHKIDELEVLRTSERTLDPLPQPPDPLLRDVGNSRFLPIDPSITAPVVITRVEPEYPEAYRMMRISGIVILELAITETGATQNFAVVKSLGPAIDMAAVDAVKKWTFKPAMRDGKPIPVLFNLTINFKLQ